MRFFTSISFFLLSLAAFAATPLTIPQIQGTGASSSYVGQEVKTSGIVTAKFIGTNKINGYFIQDATGDGNVLTSDGVFVSTTTDNVAVGDNVELTATVSEVNGRTQLGGVTATNVLSSNNALPVTHVQYNAGNWNWEQYEGMLLQFDQTLYVTSNYYLLKYGQLSLNPVRKYAVTNQCLPGSAEYIAMVALNAKAEITLDDGITATNNKPVQFADANGTRRTGERVNNLNAVVDNVGSSYYVYAATSPVFFGNSRPAAPADLGNYNLKVCAANLEYYLPYNYNGTYGAANATQAEQQHTKIIAALKAIDADIYGLIEIEEGQNALTKLVNSLNVAVPGRYAFIDDGGLPDGTYIKVGYIYRTDKVKPYLNLKENTGTSSSKYRKKAQAFTLDSNNERFIFSLNHFKAKSGCPSSGVDADQGDGQGCYNASRVTEATSTLSFVSDWKNYYNDNDVLIMGDLNAYGKEDPVQTLVKAGYVDMHRAFHADSAYSYMYNGAAGYLDNVLASSSMRSQITGVSVFHVNADEPTMFEYSGSAYQPDMYRYSDHDPVVVGLLLSGTNGLNDLSVADKIKILPNVVSDNFVVSNAEGATVQLFSVSGVLLKQEKLTSDEYTVDIKDLHLSSGVYLAKVSGKVVRLVVMKNQ